MNPELPFGPSGAGRDGGERDARDGDDARARLLDELDADDYHAGKRFEGIDFSGLPLSGHTFEACAFSSCRFRETSLARVSLISCTLEECELVLATLENATVNAVAFRKSKLVGVNFSDCNRFGFSPSFDDCLLESAVFYGNGLKKARFANSKIRNSDFIEVDLRESSFEGSSLEGSSFQKCNLERADFRAAFDYAIDPATNKLARARFTLPEAQSFLGFLGIDIN